MVNDLLFKRNITVAEFDHNSDLRKCLIKAGEFLQYYVSNGHVSMAYAETLIDEICATLGTPSISQAKETQVIDLELSHWESLKTAAAESTWIPQDLYFVNDWVWECEQYLRHGGTLNIPDYDEDQSSSVSSSIVKS